MSLLGKLFGGGKPPAPPRPARPAGLPDFTIDRARMFDIGLTGRLHQLSQTPPQMRDFAWQAEFFGALWNASISLPSDAPYIGPDGFRYLRLDIPAPGEFESNSLSNLAVPCVEAGCGAVLFGHPDAEDPVYVLPLGVIDSLLHFGDWRGDPVDIEEQQGADVGPVTIEKETSVILSWPSTHYLSRAAARAMDDYLKIVWEMPDVRVQLLGCAEFQPTRSLLLNVRASDLGDEAQARDFCSRVGWFLPPSRVITLLPENMDASEMMSLAEFGNAAD